MPALMHWFPGLKPWELDLLTPGELDECFRFIQEQSKGR